jgi:hypothetical protein
MVHECQHIYETGRKCRRIPKRGEDLCPGHRPHGKPSFHDQPDFVHRLTGFVEQLRSLSLPETLAILQDALSDIQPIIERKSSRATYEPFARASAAVGIALEQFADLRDLSEQQLQQPDFSHASTPPNF